jgi:F-type H+-transporting ATPase subunit epsilon
MQLSVLTPDGESFSGKSLSLILPGEDGLLGVLNNHAPLLAGLKEGVLQIKTEDGIQKSLQIGAGLVEVQNNSVIVLTDYSKEL